MDKEMESLLKSLKKQTQGKEKTQEIYPEDYIGKKVIVNSYRVSKAEGHVVSYLPKTHHFWVRLDKPIKKKYGGLTQWHKCNAGNVRLFIPGVDDIKQLELFPGKL